MKIEVLSVIKAKFEAVNECYIGLLCFLFGKNLEKNPGIADLYLFVDNITAKNEGDIDI